MSEEKKFVCKYESILDHNVTPKEFEEITKFPWRNRFEFIEIVNGSMPHWGWTLISQLYKMRGENDKAEKYSHVPKNEIEFYHFDIAN